MEYLISTLFIILAGFAKSFLDNSAENNFKNNKWNKSKGKNNDEAKWKYPLKPSKRKWYYLWLYKPEWEEKFIWSSTLLVSLTDWWHKFQFIMLTFFCLAIVFYTPLSSIVFFKLFGWKINLFLTYLIDFIWFRIVLSLSFETLYKKIKKILKNKK